MKTPIKVEQVDELAAASVNPAIVGFGGATGYRYLCEAFAKARIAAEAKAFEEAARAILDVRARNAGNFDRTGAAWEAYDRAVLDCHEAIRSRIPETANGR